MGWIEGALVTGITKAVVALLGVAVLVPALAWAVPQVPFEALGGLWRLTGSAAEAPAVSSPVATPEPPVRDIVHASALDLPAELALFVASGSGVERLYRDHRGAVRRERVAGPDPTSSLAATALRVTSDGAFIATPERGSGPTYLSDDWGASWRPASGADSPPREDATRVSIPGRSPSRWQGSALVGQREATLLALPSSGWPEQTLGDALGVRVAVAWHRETPQGGLRVSVFALVEGAATPYRLEHTFATPGLELVTWLDARHLLVDAGAPAVLDVASGELHPLAPFAAERATTVAVVRGPFARVMAGAGDCLRVRRSPGLQAEVLGCVPDGALMRLLETPERPEGWVLVSTPGVRGWSSAEYLEYAPLSAAAPESPGAAEPSAALFIAP
jgi:hypothetical protein